MANDRSAAVQKRRLEPDKPQAGRFLAAMKARKLVGCFAGPEDLAENHSAYLKSKLRGRIKRPR